MHDLVFLGRFHLAEMRVDLADDRVARAVQLKRPTTVRRRDSVRDALAFARSVRRSSGVTRCSAAFAESSAALRRGSHLAKMGSSA